MINVLSGVVMLLLLALLWIMVRYDRWYDVMRDAEEEK